MAHEHQVRTFFRALEDGDLRRALELCARDLAVVAPGHRVISRLDFERVIHALHRALPDLHYDIGPLVEADDLLEGRMTISGTHTRDLDVALWELPVVPASGRRLTIEGEPLQVTMMQGKIRRIGSPVPGARGILAPIAELGLSLEPAGLMG
jgi:hypothetical protein